MPLYVYAFLTLCFWFLNLFLTYGLPECELCVFVWLVGGLYGLEGAWECVCVRALYSVSIFFLCAICVCVS